MQAPIERFFWNRIIADESHVLKSMTTQMSKAMQMLAARNRWCVTGTPITMDQTGKVLVAVATDEIYLFLTCNFFLIFFNL